MPADLQPCGRRDPACPRPESCDDCLPRDRRLISDRVLTRCDPAWYGLRDDPPPVFAALRAVVELCVEHQADGVDGRLTDVDLIPPSEVVRTIAQHLGIRDEGDH